MIVSVNAIRKIATDTIEIDLADSDGLSLPPFEPGAHIEIEFCRQRFLRRYTLTSDPGDLSQYSIAVLKAPEGKGGSIWLHNYLSAGQSVVCSQPINNFRLVPDARRYLLIAGGIGITPIFSFARALSRSSLYAELHYTARSYDRLAFLSALESFGLKKFQTYSDADPRPMNVKTLVPTYKDGCQIYVCGPRTLIEAVKDIAFEKDWPIFSIHYESFGVVRNAQHTFDVYLSQSDMTITVPPGKTILEVAEENGVWVSYGCKRGECGKCTASFSEGDVQHNDLCLSSEARKRMMCPCVLEFPGFRRVFS